MPDEQTNEQIVNDFFSLDGIEAPEGLSSGESQPASQQPSLAPNANTATNPNQQQQAPAQQQPLPPNSQSQQPPNQQAQQQSQTPAKGFEQNFFTDDGKGNQVLNIDSAMSFLTKQATPNVDSQTPNYRQMSFQQPLNQQPAQPQQPEKQTTPFDQVEQYAENIRANVLSGYEAAIEAMQQAGLWNAENINAVNLSKKYESLKSGVEQAIREKRTQIFNEYENNRSEKIRQEDALKPIREKAGINLLAQYNRLGGKDNFEQLIFGKEVNGKLVGGYGVDIINHMIDVAYEVSGKEFPKTPQEMQKAYNDFYDRLCAKPERLQHLVEIAEVRVAKTFLPQILSTTRANKEAEIQQRQKAQQMSPSQIQTQQKQSQNDAFSEFLGYDWQNRAIDTV